MGEQRERTRIRCRVDDFPQDVRDQLDAMLRDTRYTYLEIAQTMTDQGYEISKSSIHRYAMRINAAAARLQAAAEQTRQLVKQLQDNQDVEAAEVATALLMDGLTNRIASADEEFDKLPLDKAGNLLVQIQRSNVYKNRYKQDRKRAIASLETNIMVRIRDMVQGDDALTDRLMQLVNEAAREEAAKDDT